MSNGKTGESKRTKQGAVTMTQEQFETAISEVVASGAKAQVRIGNANATRKEVAKDLVRVLNTGVQAKLDISKAHEAVINEALSDESLSEKVRTSRANYLGSTSMDGHKLFTALHNMGSNKEVREELARMVAEDAIFVSGKKGILTFCADRRDSVENIKTTTDVSRADFEDLLESLPIGESVDIVGALFPDGHEDSRNARKFMESRLTARVKLQAWMTALDEIGTRVHKKANPKVKSYKPLPTMAEYVKARAASS
jgi:hypothetical protein